MRTRHRRVASESLSKRVCSPVKLGSRGESCRVHEFPPFEKFSDSFAGFRWLCHYPAHRLQLGKMPQNLLMRSSVDLDSESLLPRERQSNLDSTACAWKDEPDAWGHSQQGKKSGSSWTTPILIVSNVITVIVVVVLMLISRQPSSDSSPPVNHPPKGVAPTLAHLAQHTEPRVWNYSFYDDGSWTRKHDSVEADRMWMNYTQVGKSTPLSVL
jgi:hypothetical protein